MKHTVTLRKGKFSKVFVYINRSKQPITNTLYRNIKQQDWFRWHEDDSWSFSMWDDEGKMKVFSGIGAYDLWMLVERVVSEQEG